MSKIKLGLGRGLDALINPHNLNDNVEQSPDYNNLKKDDGKEINILAKIPVNNISSNPFQPRTNFDPAALDELKKSILSNGLIQPITVRRKSDNHYELISGERRLKACIDIGYIDIPAYIIKVDSDEAMLAMALIENIQREKLNAIEVAAAYKRLMDECHLTQEQIAETVGKDRATVANTIRLLKLPDKIQKSLISEEITMGHARALINLPSEELQLSALKKIIENNLSVRKVEQLVKNIFTDTKIRKTYKPGIKSNVNSAGASAIEDKLMKLFGTKVTIRQKADNNGEVILEFYSLEDLDRLIELFEMIEIKYS
jgi:ParB family chromosome partitioning protein